jgi:hypothetical protein
MSNQTTGITHQYSNGVARPEKLNARNAKFSKKDKNFSIKKNPFVM